MKEDIRFIEIQLPQDSEIIKALIASRNKEENIDNVEISLYLGKGKRPLKIILRPKDESLDFDVTTPHDTKGKVCTYIGKAQFAKAIPIGIPINSANLTDLYSLSIEIVEQPTNFAESFIERIKVLKDELGVAKETLRLTGDIFHILPNAKKRFNIVKNKINFEHFDSPKIDSLNQKENNGLFLYLDIPVAKSILLPEILKDLKKWKNILSFKPIFITFNNGSETGHVSKFVYKAHSPKGNDCTYELVAKCVINNSNLKEITSDLSISPSLLGPTIKASAVKSLEKAYLNYITEERVVEPYPHPIRYTEDFIGKKIETSANSKSEEKNSECVCCKSNELSELFEKIREFANNLPIAQIESLSQIDIDTKNGNKPSGYTSRIKTIYPDLNPSPVRFKDKVKDDVSAPKATETIIVPFSIVLKDIMAYDHLLDYTKYYKATFRIKDKEFKGEIKSMNIQYPFATTVDTRRASPSSIKAIVNIAITQECKDTIDNLVKEILGFEEVCVGSLNHHLLNKSAGSLYTIKRSAGALYTIKSYAEKEDRQTINIDMSLNTVVELERFSHLVNKYSNLPFMVSTDPFVVSTDNEQAARIIYCADTEEEAVSLIMDIKEKLKNRFIDNKSKQSNFPICNNYINVEIKSFSSDNTILRVQDVVLVASSRDLGKYFVVAKLQ